jgi:hypothetical protein
VTRRPCAAARRKIDGLIIPLILQVCSSYSERRGMRTERCAVCVCHYLGKQGCRRPLLIRRSVARVREREGDEPPRVAFAASWAMYKEVQLQHVVVSLDICFRKSVEYELGGESEVGLRRRQTCQQMWSISRPTPTTRYPYRYAGQNSR